MSHLFKGVVSFPKVFTAAPAKGSDTPKFGITILFPPTDSQVAQIQALQDEASRNGAPSGLSPGAGLCFQPYDTKYQGKDYYDPKFSGWFALSATAVETDKPAVVDMNRNPVIDPSKVYAGCVAYVSLGISYYAKGKTGVGGWLNGVMVTDELPPMGRLDNKPTVDQMFATAGAGGATPPAATPPAVAPPPAPSPAAPPAAPAPVRQMTALAAGATYDQFIAQGWDDAGLIQSGYMVTPGGVPTSFQ